MIQKETFCKLSTESTSKGWFVLVMIEMDIMSVSVL